jgi:uridylate kinase
VDGVYDRDPKKFADAKRFDTVTYLETLEKRLGVMDATAISLARDNRLPIIVFNLFEQGNIRRVIKGEKVGTIVEGGN